MNPTFASVDVHQELKLQKDFDATDGLDALRALGSDAFSAYGAHRMALASWVLEYNRTRPDLDNVFLPCLNLADRYATTKVARAGDGRGALRDVLIDATSVRAACLNLAVKMYGTRYATDPKLVHSTNAWPVALLEIEDGVPYRRATWDSVVRAERDVLVTLRGAAFPVHDEQCVAPLVELMDLEDRLDSRQKEWAAARATRVLRYVSLDLDFVARTTRWQRSLACVALGFLDAAYTFLPRDESGGDVDLCVCTVLEEWSFGDLSKFAQQTSECPVCAACDDDDTVASRSLRRCAKDVCDVCRKRRRAGTRGARTAREPHRPAFFASELLKEDSAWKERYRTALGQRLSLSDNEDEFSEENPTPLGDFGGDTDLICYETLSDSEG